MTCCRDRNFWTWCGLAVKTAQSVKVKARFYHWYIYLASCIQFCFTVCESANPTYGADSLIFYLQLNKNTSLVLSILVSVIFSSQISRNYIQAFWLVELIDFLIQCVVLQHQQFHLPQAQANLLAHHCAPTSIGHGHLESETKKVTCYFRCKAIMAMVKHACMLLIWITNTVNNNYKAF